MSMGLPSVIISDQDKEFNNRLDKTLTSLLGIEHGHTLSSTGSVQVVLISSKWS